MDDPLSLAANLIEVTMFVVTVTVSIRKIIRDTKFKSTYRSKPNSIFRIAKDRMDALVDMFSSNYRDLTLIKIFDKEGLSSGQVIKKMNVDPNFRMPSSIFLYFLYISID